MSDPLDSLEQLIEKWRHYGHEMCAADLEAALVPLKADGDRVRAALQLKNRRTQMASTADYKVTKNIVDISHIPCPACGRSDRWDAMAAEEPPSNNPQIKVFCDCGLGELVIVASGAEQAGVFAAGAGALGDG
jgi:hypothetical protein